MAVVSPLAAGESLAVGDEGEQVGELQRQLHHLGYYQGEIDQRYGDATESAVREFQKASSRPDDGRVERETWETLDQAAQFAGYDANGHHDAAVPDQNAEAAQMSDDGEWWWDGTEWRAVNEQGHDQTVGSHAEEPRQLSDDGRWEWDGANWKAVDHKAGDQSVDTANQTPSVDLKSFPEVREGDSGEWVTYLNDMLTSAGY